MIKNKIGIIGSGTAGCISAANIAYASKNTDVEIEWHYDPNNPTQAVGEGTTVDIPEFLFQTIGFDWNDLKTLDGNYKTGIRKTNWSHNGGDFSHKFVPSKISMHFNARKLQSYILNKIERLYPNVKIIEGSITKEEVDSDFVLDCTGFPKEDTQLNITKNIPVNATYITACYWDYPKFDHTLAIARPYGWVFGIPLQNRCSIGYMYDNTLNSLEEIKQDAKEVFNELNLIPSEDTNSFQFKNFYRKENFSGRYGYNGNSSFFLEPMEATSIFTMRAVSELSIRKLFGGWTDSMCNESYTRGITEIETMINLHYLSSSKFDTEFWRKSNCIAEEVISKSLESHPEFRNIILNAINGVIGTDLYYGSWIDYSYEKNIEGLNIKNKLKQMMRKYE
jgi:hypothetical protein